MPEIVLRGGAVTGDRRLDRIAQHDVRNSEFPVRALLAPGRYNALRSQAWQVPITFDQGVEGQCVAYGIAHFLIARPHGLDLALAQKLLDTHEIYWGAQQRDPWDGGAYPDADPVYDGTSVLAGIQQVKAMGLIGAYHWARTERDVAEAIAWHGPVVLGLNWYEGMAEADRAGRITPTGQILGGHCVLVSGLDVRTGLYRIRNSWGQSWGVRGDCYLRRRDLSQLLAEDGSEACVPAHQ